MKNSLACTLIIIFMHFFTVSAVAQSGEGSTPPLKMSVALKQTACLGKSFTLTATLKNTSGRDYVIDPVGMWLSYGLTATERFVGRASIIGVKGTMGVPDISIRGGGKPPWASPSEVRRRLMKLKPNESFTSEKIFDPTCDDFFDTPGVYNISVSYVPELADADQVIGLTGSTESENLRFTIQRCD